MADVYILYSRTLCKYYIGSCENVDFRLQQHLLGSIPGSFTSKAKDWEIYLTISGLGFKQARAIESHIKLMKSKSYLQNLKHYPEIIQRLISLYFLMNVSTPDSYRDGSERCFDRAEVSR